MPFLVPLLQAVAACRICRWILLGAALLVVAGIFVAHERHQAAAEARAAALAEAQAATAAESARRQQVLEQAQRDAAAAIARIADMEKRNAALQAQIAQLSAAHDRDPCLLRPASGRLQRIKDRPAASDGAR